jgi:hypothetical protein
VFSLAYVILPFSDTAPADAIRASLARFQRGRRGELPDEWLAFHDETDELRREHEANLVLTETDAGGLRIEGIQHGLWHADAMVLREEMRRRGLRRWSVRLADEMGLEEFCARFARKVERHPETGAFGRWLNPLGRWDWWDLGGRFDGGILGERRRARGRRVAAVSSGGHQGRAILSRVEDTLAEALGQEPTPELDVRSDQNIELVSTLLEDVLAGRENGCPATLVLPPGSVEDRLRWIGTWPQLGPAEAIGWLGLPADASWTSVVTAAYARSPDYWAAGVAYHH